MFENVDRRMDDGVTGILLAHPWAFGSGELKMDVNKIKENSDQNLDLAFAGTCHLLITFANSLEPDQARQYVRHDLDPSCLILVVFLKEFFTKVDCEESQQSTKSMQNYPVDKRVKEAFELMR